MDELYIPVVVFKNGGEEDDIYFAGTKEELMDCLVTDELTEFFTKDECGNRATTILARSADVDVVEIDEPDEIAEELRSAKEDDAKVIDITGLLEKLTNTAYKSDARKDLNLGANIDATLWRNAKFAPVSSRLVKTLMANFSYADGTVAELYDAFIHVAMDAADAVTFFLGAQDDERAAKVIAKLICDSIEEKVKEWDFDTEKILELLSDEDYRDTLIEDLFSSVLDTLESIKD